MTLLVAGVPREISDQIQRRFVASLYKPLDESAHQMTADSRTNQFPKELIQLVSNGPLKCADPCLASTIRA